MTGSSWQAVCCLQKQMSSLGLIWIRDFNNCMPDVIFPFSFLLPSQNVDQGEELPFVQIYFFEGNAQMIIAVLLCLVREWTTCKFCLNPIGRFLAIFLFFNQEKREADAFIDDELWGWDPRKLCILKCCTRYKLVNKGRRSPFESFSRCVIN